MTKKKKEECISIIGLIALCVGILSSGVFIGYQAHKHRNKDEIKFAKMRDYMPVNIVAIKSVTTTKGCEYELNVSCNLLGEDCRYVWERSCPKDVDDNCIMWDSMGSGGVKFKVGGN